MSDKFVSKCDNCDNCICLGFDKQYGVRCKEECFQSAEKELAELRADLEKKKELIIKEIVFEPQTSAGVIEGLQKALEILGGEKL